MRYPLIDIMAVYTLAAATTQGGVSKAEAWIDDAILSINMAMRNSGVDLRVDLVYKGQVQYTEEIDDRTDLNNLRQGLSGSGLESISALRQEYHADVVMLMTNSSQGGRADRLASLTGNPAINGFGVFRIGVTSLILHEFGHMLGAKHNERTPPYPNGAIFQYAHGYTGVNYTPSSILGGWPTGSSPTIGKAFHFYSNPDLKFRNAPLGNSTTGDNRRAFNQTGSVIAALFDRQVKWIGKNNDWDDPQNWSTQRVPRRIDDVVIPSGLCNYPIIENGVKKTRELLVESGATLSMTGGQLFVRGDLKAGGIFIAEGGHITLHSNLEKAVELSLSNDSWLNDLQIGDGTTNTWARLNTALKMKGNLTIEKGTLLDPAGHSICVDGDWTDKGNGFDYSNPSVKVGQQVNPQPTPVKYPIPPNSGGSYISELSGWNSLAEFGNHKVTWFFGGSNGDALLSNQSIGQDRPNFMDAIDAWLFMPPTLMQAGIEYKLEFECKTDSRGPVNAPREVSIHYGNKQLPSLMTNTGISKIINPDIGWVTVSGKMHVSRTDMYCIGIRTYNSNEQNVAYSYIQNIKLTPVSNANQATGNWPQTPSQPCWPASPPALVTIHNKSAGTINVAAGSGNPSTQIQPQANKTVPGLPGVQLSNGSHTYTITSFPQQTIYYNPSTGFTTCPPTTNLPQVTIHNLSTGAINVIVGTGTSPTQIQPQTDQTVTGSPGDVISYAGHMYTITPAPTQTVYYDPATGFTTSPPPSATLPQVTIQNRSAGAINVVVGTGTSPTTILAGQDQTVAGSPGDVISFGGQTYTITSVPQQTIYYVLASPTTGFPTSPSPTPTPQPQPQPGPSNPLIVITNMTNEEVRAAVSDASTTSPIHHNWRLQAKQPYKVERHTVSLNRQLQAGSKIWIGSKFYTITADPIQNIEYYSYGFRTSPIPPAPSTTPNTVTVKIYNRLTWEHQFAIVKYHLLAPNNFETFQIDNGTNMPKRLHVGDTIWLHAPPSSSYTVTADPNQSITFRDSGVIDNNAYTQRRRGP